MMYIVGFLQNNVETETIFYDYFSNSLIIKTMFLHKPQLSYKYLSRDGNWMTGKEKQFLS